MTKTINHRSKNLLSTIALISAGIVPAASFAETVTLKSSDGTVNLVGEFVEFTDETYIIKTSLGNLRISASRVRCEGAACPVFETETADVSFAGSDTVAVGLMPLLMTGYSDIKDADVEVSNPQPGQTITKLIGDQGFGDELGSFLVTSSGSDQAFQALLDKTAQIGMTSRRITPDEARALRDTGAGNMVSPTQERVVAVDSIIVITHPSNPVATLSIDDLRRIYTGEVNNWSAFGGPDLKIAVHGYADGFDTQQVFYERIFGGAANAAPVSDIEITEDSNQMALQINEDAAAIGFVGFAFQRGAKAVQIANECGIVTSPDEFSAKTEEYAIQRRLYFYNRADNTDPSTQEFLDYVTSSGSDDVIAKSGFISLGIIRTPQDLKGNRARSLMEPNADPYQSSQMREMLGAMIDQDRLSTTFRYRTGSAKLDEKGILDMRRLSSYLEALPQGTRVSFVGFTDDEGAFDANRKLSIARAEQVAADIKAMTPSGLPNIEISTNGFGELSPAACNTTSNGKALNRRVEVWVQASN